MFGFKNDQYYIDWQNNIMSRPADRLIMTKEQLQQMTDMQGDNAVRIITESLAIVKSTHNESTRSSRIALIKEMNLQLIKISRYYKLPKNYPTGEVERLINAHPEIPATVRHRR